MKQLIKDEGRDLECYILSIYVGISEHTMVDIKKTSSSFRSKIDHEGNIIPMRDFAIFKELFTINVEVKEPTITITLNT